MAVVLQDWERTVVSTVAYRLTALDSQVRAAVRYVAWLTKHGRQTQREAILKYGLEGLPEDPAQATIPDTDLNPCKLSAQVRKAQLDSLWTTLLSKAIHGVYSKEIRSRTRTREPRISS